MLRHPWDSPGKSTEVGCHCFLLCMKVKSESEVAQSCLTLRDPMDCSLPGSFIHGIFQARVLEWGAIAFSAFFPYSSFLSLPWTLCGHLLQGKCGLGEDAPKLTQRLSAHCRPRALSHPVPLLHPAPPSTTSRASTLLLRSWENWCLDSVSVGPEGITF